MIFVTSHVDGGITITVPAESVSDFQKLISRGCNTWDRASPEIKTFHDTIVNGSILQDYDTLES